MRKSVKDIDARFFKVVDLETGLDINRVIFANDVTGFHIKYDQDEQGKLKIVNNEVVKVYKCGRIRLVDVRKEL